MPRQTAIMAFDVTGKPIGSMASDVENVGLMQRRDFDDSCN